MGTEKRERQKVGRQAAIEARLVQANRARRRRTALRVGLGVAVVVLALLGYTALKGDDDSDTEAADTTPGTSDTSLPETTTTTFSDPELADEVLSRDPPEPAPPPADTAADALEVETLIEGEGETEAAAGDIVVAHYVGVLADGTVFDESWSRQQPLTLPAPLGQGGVIRGWDQGLVGARIGDRLRLVIGADNAYGAEGSPPAIPPNAPLAFEVDVVDVYPADAAQAPGVTPPPAG